MKCYCFWLHLVLLSVLLAKKAHGTTPTTLDEDEDDFDSDEDLSEVEDDKRVYKNPRNSPSTLCPRDEEQAKLLKQKCLRKCSTDEDCKSKKKKCLCDGACGMSCIKPDRECPELPHPELGTVNYSGRLFGDRASYSCPHGYHVVGLESRNCQADGNWAGTTPTCKQNIYCLSPPTIAHARHDALPEQLTFDLDTSLQYYCQTGYHVTNGFPKAKCLAVDGQASWYGPDITCEPRSCGPPTDIPQGWHAGECYSYNCKVTYHCSEGHELVGKAERTCQADGTWLPKELPTCVPVQCSTPENPRHGKAIYTSCSYNSVVSYECKYGYTLVGETTRRCGADRKWSGAQPACKEINCGHPGRLWNGWLENIEAGTGLGASIIFRCHDGMRLEGNSSTVCQIDGKWRYPLPKCLAPCVVPQVSQGKVILLNRDNDTFPQPTVVQHGEELSVECEPNYEFITNQVPVTCNNGTWTLMPRCQPARCKQMPKSPKNGMVIAPKTDHGMRAKFRCKDGFALKGYPFVECLYGNWTGELPMCQEVYCPFPGYLENGKVLLVGNMGLYDYRPYVRKVINNKQIMYDCNKGYFLSEGPPGATCIGGHWSPKNLPRCTLGQHPRIRWNRRRRSIALTELEEILKKPIHKSFRLQRSLAVNLWHRRAKRGWLPPKNENVKNVRRNERRKGKKKVEGGLLAEKGSKKKLRGPCEAIPPESFMDVEVVKHGRDPNITYSAGTVVRVSCSKGYSLNMEPNSTAKCVKGSWKPMKPVCSILPCRVPKTPNGVYKLSVLENTAEQRVELNETSDISNGQVVEFSCSTGYNVQGTMNLRCWHGEWNANAMPECVAAPCQLPQINNGQYLSGYRAGLMIANGSSVTFQCDSDYSKSTAQPVECILGELYPKTPSCSKGTSLNRTTTTATSGRVYEKPHFLGGSDIIKGGDISALDYGTSITRPCGPPARVQGSLIYRDGIRIVEDERSFPHGSEVTFNCIESIMGERTTWRIVCEDGSWIGRSLNCDSDDYNGEEYTNNNTCIFRNQEPNVVTFHNDQEVKEDVVEFSPGAVLVSRCVDIGKYAMIGSSSRKCFGGKWDSPKPTCFGLNQENDYSMEKPPTILFRHQLGPIAQSNDGKLVVYPGTILHMECLWIRRFGTPKWNVSHDFRKYPEGWNTEPERDSQLEYRISIFHAAKDDSGMFTCITPARYTHSVEIIVKAVHCPEPPMKKGLTLSSQSTKMNTKVTFSCSNGNSLIGAKEVICLPSGNWSAPWPVCESVECGEALQVQGEFPTRLRATVISREVGGRAVFSCAPGYGLKGPTETVCLPTGEWAKPLPTCAEVQCEHPGAPEHGYVQGTGPFKAGDVVQFNCDSDFMMEGQPIIACQESSRWSGPVPKCVQACSYPGTAISGRMSSVKFYYRIGENVTFECDEGLALRGASMLKCLRNGKWSNAIPTCVVPNAGRREEAEGDR